MLFSKRSKSFSLGVISTIILMVAILILSGCGDDRNPVEVESQRIEQYTKPIPFLKEPLEGVLPSVETPPEVD